MSPVEHQSGIGVAAASPAAERDKALYRRLRPGPHGEERNHEEVLKNQRARILGAMIEAVAQRGYAAVSVQQVVTLAGVSKRTFYEQFSCKEECFLATFDALSLEALRGLAAVCSEHEDREARLHALLDFVLSNVANGSKEARLRMIEVFAAGPAGYERARQVQARVEAVFAASIPHHSDAPPPVAVKGMVHGLRHLISSHLFSGALDRLPALTAELFDWMTSYRCVSAGLLRDAPSLAPGRRQVVKPFDRSSSDERRRLQHAALHLAGRRGWLALSRPSLCKLAGVDERTFEQLYGDVDDCFIEALDLLAAEALAPMLAAARRAPREWPAQIEASVAALLATLAADPVLARAAFVEAAYVGPRGIERGNRLLDGFAKLLCKSAPAEAALSETVAQAITGAACGVLHDYIRAGASDRLSELVPHLSYLVLTPAIGASSAIECLQAADSRSGEPAVSYAL